ncbi:MAG: hypothetical protein V7K49_06730 [Nostoc sp.]
MCKDGTQMRLAVNKGTEQQREDKQSLRRRSLSVDIALPKA